MVTTNRIIRQLNRIGIGSGIAALLAISLCGCALQRYEPRPVVAENVAKELESRSLRSPELERFVLSRPKVTSAPQWPPSKWDPDSLTLVALFFNPVLETERAKLATTEAEEVTAGQRPNPVLQLPLQKTINPSDRDSPWTLGLVLDIPIETAGKRSYRMERAAHLVSAARLQLAETAWGVRRQLREQLVTLWASTARAELLQQQFELDQNIVDMLEKRLAVGYASPWEINQQRLSLIQARTQLLAARREIELSKVHVAAVLGLRPSALDGMELDLGRYQGSPPPLPSQEIQKQALLNRSDVLAGLARYEATQSSLQLEVARQYPNLHLGPGYVFDQGAKRVGFDFSGVELPIFNRNEGPIAEARARRIAAESEIRQIQSKALAEVNSALAAYRLAQESVRQADEQLTVQRRQLETARRSLQLGEENRLAFALAQKSELQARMTALDFSTQLQQAAGRIEDTMQRPIMATAPSMKAN